MDPEAIKGVKQIGTQGGTLNCLKHQTDGHTLQQITTIGTQRGRLRCPSLLQTDGHTHTTACLWCRHRAFRVQLLQVCAASVAPALQASFRRKHGAGFSPGLSLDWPLTGTACKHLCTVPTLCTGLMQGGVSYCSMCLGPFQRRASPLLKTAQHCTDVAYQTAAYLKLSEAKRGACLGLEPNPQPPLHPLPHQSRLSRACPPGQASCCIMTQ
eukprot:1159645-Pelagomonas_calceolata.AAC.3